MLAIGVDLGGTKVAAGVVDEGGNVLAREQAVSSGSQPAELVDAIGSTVLRLLAAHRDVGSVGIGAAGFVDAERSRVMFAPNLSLRDAPLPSEVADRIGRRVVLENDSNAMAWAEHRFGAGQGVDPLVCLTIGTGIGGGLVLEGHLYRGAFGIAGEVGHLRVVPDGRPCGCGQHGCLEQYASGPALARTARELAAAEPGRARTLLESGGGDADAVTGEQVTAAAAAGDPLARECFRVVGEWLGAGLASIAAVCDPARIVVGGGVLAAGELLLEPTRVAYRRTLTGGGHRPEADIVAAQLGPDAGLVGAADLSRREPAR